MRSWISVLAAFIALNAFDAPAQQPPENLTGHYLTGFHGEGVFIEHQGNTAFLTFVTYDSTGQGTWFVMPDARGYSSGVDTIQFTRSLNGDQYAQYSRSLRRYRF